MSSTADPIMAGFGIGLSALCIIAVGAVLGAGAKTSRFFGKNFFHNFFSLFLFHV